MENYFLFLKQLVYPEFKEQQHPYGIDIRSLMYDSPFKPFPRRSALRTEGVNMGTWFRKEPVAV